MAQSLSNILVHVVFSTKDRYPFLSAQIRPELHAYMATALKSVDSPALIINSVADHVHFLCMLSKNRPICEIVQAVKTCTSKWIKTKDDRLENFRWQNGYGAFSVSQSNVPSVKQYITDQEAHHRRVGFQDEYRLLLARHGIDFDERFVWD